MTQRGDKGEESAGRNVGIILDRKVNKAHETYWPVVINNSDKNRW